MHNLMKLPLITAIGVAAVTVGVGTYYFTAEPSHPPAAKEKQGHALEDTSATAKEQETAPGDLEKIEKKETKSIPKFSDDTSKYAGSYRCWSYNVSGGGGGNCRLFAPLVLKSNGLYSLSSEAGTFSVEGNTMYLSESKIRGSGTLLEGGLQIRFEYDYNGWHHVLTYLKESANEENEKSSAAISGGKYVEVTLHIVYPAGDSSADSVNTVTIYPKEGGPQVAQSLAYATDRQTTEVWFSKRPPKTGLLTGKVYKVMVGSGFGEWQVGELDLLGVLDNVERTIIATLSKSSSGDL